jgi:hypothetical protein
VKLRAEGIESAEGKQKIVVELYDKFFRNAFPKMSERLGIVYTPVEIVDFILHSVELRAHARPVAALPPGTAHRRPVARASSAARKGIETIVRFTILNTACRPSSSSLLTAIIFCQFDYGWIYVARRHRRDGLALHLVHGHGRATGASPSAAR